MIRHFRATVIQSGHRTYVELPFNADDAWGLKERHYITGSVGGSSIRGCLERRGTGFLLVLGTAWRRDNQVDAGQDVEVALAPEGPLVDTLSPDVAAALDAERDARTFFETVAPFYRKNYVRWIESARRPQTRATRIAETIALLKAGVKQR